VKLFPSLIAASVLAAPQLSYAAGNVNATLGARQLDKDLWDPVDHQAAFGILADFSLGQLPLWISVGLQASASEEEDPYFDYTGAVADLSAGLKFMPRAGTFRPYVGAGVASVGASFEAEGTYCNISYCFPIDDDDSDRSFGYYANAGALFRIGKHLNVGVDLRWIGGTDINLFGVSGDANSFVGSAFVGFGWD
jgi:opacity protein-like surface antigen